MKFTLNKVYKKKKFTLNNKGKQSTEFKMHFKEINVRTKVASTIASDRDRKKKIHINSICFFIQAISINTIFFEKELIQFLPKVLMQNKWSYILTCF